MAQDMDWDDIANMWWSHFEDMETDPTPRQGIKRGRSRSRTPATTKRSDRAPSRARGMQPRKLTFSSARTRSRSRSASESRKKAQWGKAAFFAANKNLPNDVIEKIWRQTAQGKRNQATLDRLKLSKVRHKLTRKDARKIMPRGKPYTRRTTKKPRGGYRGAVMPKWAKGETKHILMNDQCNEANTGDVDPGALNQVSGSGLIAQTGETLLDIGELRSWSLNPMKQGNGITERNGRSVDGTYLRIQGHVRNKSTTAEGNKAYVRMMVLAVKGGDFTGTSTTRGAPFNKSALFKKIDGSIVAWNDSTEAHAAEARVRSLQLPINKALYTVLADQKFQLAHKGESFGSSDRLFDLKMKLKQRTTWHEATKCDSFERNQLVFVVYSCDPDCSSDTPVADRIPIEFESKYSYKDF